MNNLIKAEWYRIIHTGILKYFIIVCCIFPVIIIMTDLNCYKMTISENMILFAQNAAMMAPLFLTIAISIPISQIYQNKLAYYEIMSGMKIRKIILSKVVIYNAIFVVGTAFTLVMYFGILGIINGVGDMSNIPLRFVLFIILIIHICTVSVLICMLVKHIIALAIVLLRFMFFDSLMMLFIMPIDSELDIAVIGSQNSSDWFISGQMTKIFSADINSNMILMVIATTAFEIAVWYILTYISYKKKMF